LILRKERGTGKKKRKKTCRVGWYLNPFSQRFAARLFYRSKAAQEIISDPN